MAVEPTKGKPVKAAPAVSVEEAIVDLVAMIRFLNANKGYWAEDYINEDHFKASALGKLLEMSSK